MRSLIALSLLNVTRELSWKVSHPAASFFLSLLLNVSVLVAPDPEPLSSCTAPVESGLRFLLRACQRDKDVPRTNVSYQAPLSNGGH